MAFSLPDAGEGLAGLQSALFQEYLEALVAAAGGKDLVLSGGAVTTSAGLTVAIAKAAVLSNGTLFAVAATTKTHGTADATNPRLDLVVVDSAGAVQIRAGTAAASPKPPNRTANDVLLAVVYVSPTLATVASGNIVDLRVKVSGPLVLKKTTAGVTFTNDAGQNVFFTITLPSGLLLAGSQVRVRCCGSYLSNSGAGTNRSLRITYGGSTIFEDSFSNISNDADPGAWDLDFTLTASANNAQVLDGEARFQTQTGKNAPTTGTAGDLAVATHTCSPIRGSLAIDSDAGDRVLTVEWKMNNNTATQNHVMDHGSAVLL